MSGASNSSSRTENHPRLANSFGGGLRIEETWECNLPDSRVGDVKGVLIQPDITKAQLAMVFSGKKTAQSVSPSPDVCAFRVYCTWQHTEKEINNRNRLESMVNNLQIPAQPLGFPTPPHL